MKKIKLLQTVSIIFITIFFHANALSLERVHPNDLTYKPIKLNPVIPDKTVLKSGMLIYTLEDHELPLFTINAVIKTGAIYEPEEKTGLASMTGSVLRSGGTKSMSWEEIDGKLEFIAGSVETNIGSDSGAASLSVMTKDIDEGLKIFADVLMHPVFAQEKIDITKNQAVEAIRRENDNPGMVARREFRKLLYRDHPYGRKSTIESVSSITREDMIAFHKKYYHPNNVMLGITGDFNKKEIIEKIQMVFKDWKKKEVAFPEVPPVKKDLKRSVNYVYKDVKQSVIRLGHMGLDYRNPDHYAVMLMNYILGGGSFQSRMMQDIRNDRGLAYSVWSYFQLGMRDIGVFASGSGTKLQSTVTVISRIEDIIREMRESPVKDEELKNAKEYIINSFVFKFTSTARIVNRFLTFEYYGLPTDYLKTYLDNIRKVTKEDILRVAQKYLKPDQTVILVVGNKEKFEAPLNKFGPVTEIKLKSYKN
tara:strand:- start:16706 stop:18139 length:1434 start_codon:yes stop_codon:yes gene_type:complete